MGGLTIIRPIGVKRAPLIRIAKGRKVPLGVAARRKGTRAALAVGRGDGRGARAGGDLDEVPVGQGEDAARQGVGGGRGVGGRAGDRGRDGGDGRGDALVVDADPGGGGSDDIGAGDEGWLRGGDGDGNGRGDGGDGVEEEGEGGEGCRGEVGRVHVEGLGERLADRELARASRALGRRASGSIPVGSSNRARGVSSELRKRR